MKKIDVIQNGLNKLDRESRGGRKSPRTVYVQPQRRNGKMEYIQSRKQS
jgi:hypothetical protein